MKTISIKPTPQEYAQQLRFILMNSTLQENKEWAADELIRIAPALAAGKWES